MGGATTGMYRVQDVPNSSAALQYSPRSAAFRAASFVAAACLPSLAEAEFAAAPRHSRRWSPGWRHSWRRNPLVFVGSFRRCAGPHHRGSGLRTTKTNRPIADATRASLTHPLPELVAPNQHAGMSIRDGALGENLYCWYFLFCSFPFSLETSYLGAE